MSIAPGATFRGSTTTAAVAWLPSARAFPGGGRARDARPPPGATWRGPVRTRRSCSCRTDLRELGALARVGLEGRAHQAHGPVQTGLRRSQGDPQAGGDRGKREVEVVMEDDHGPHLRIEPEEAAFELVTIGDRRLVADDGRVVERRDLDVDAVTPQPARFVDAGTDEKSMQPGIEALRIPQRG